MAKIAFKSDNQGQIQLLPPSLDELIPTTHPVRVLNSIVDRLNVSQVLASYKGGGNSCFHPRMMLKILIYAYLNNIYSSRKSSVNFRNTSITCGYRAEHVRTSVR